MGRVQVRLMAVITAGALVQALLPVLPPLTALVADNVLLAVIAMVTVVGHIGQARASRGRTRLGWSLAAAGAGSWSLSSWVDTVGVLLTATTALDEWLAILAALLAVTALGLAGMSGSAGGEANLRRLIDVATVAGALFFLAWELVVDPGYVGGESDDTLVVVLVLVPEITGAAYAVVLLSRSLSRNSDLALSLLALSLAAFATTVLLAVHNAAQGLPWYATGVGAGYVIAGLLCALASRAPLPPETVNRDEQDVGGWAMLPYVPVVLAFAAAAWRYLHTGYLTPVLFWLLLGTAVLVMTRQFLSLRTTVRLTHRLQEQQERLAYQASHDGLTGLANRTAFQVHATAVLQTAAADELTGVLVLDLDGFKQVNDTLGHAAGDELLVGVAARLRAAVRTGDTVARLGGDEFVILLPRLRRAEDVERVGGGILRRLAEPITLADRPVGVRASIGAAVAVGTGTAAPELVKQADAALYQAKAGGKGIMRRHTPAEAPSASA